MNENPLQAYCTKDTVEYEKWQRLIKFIEDKTCHRLPFTSGLSIYHAKYIAFKGINDASVVAVRELYKSRGEPIPYPTSRRKSNFTFRYLPKKVQVIVIQRITNALRYLDDHYVLMEKIKEAGQSKFLHNVSIKAEITKDLKTKLTCGFPEIIVSNKVLGRARLEAFLPCGASGVNIFSLDDTRINPHAGNMGRGGNPCWGGFAYPIDVCLKDKDIEGCLITVQDYLKTIDDKDAWGSRIFNYPTVVTSKGKSKTRGVIPTSDTYAITNKTLSNLGLVNFNNSTDFFVFSGGVYEQNEFVLPIGVRKPITIEEAEKSCVVFKFFVDKSVAESPARLRQTIPYTIRRGLVGE